VCVDIDSETNNIDPKAIAAAIAPATKAILPVHAWAAGITSRPFTGSLFTGKGSDIAGVIFSGDRIRF
jgi:DegT/DnrJ/EryC1/StrS aminotransferase family